MNFFGLRQAELTSSAQAWYEPNSFGGAVQDPSVKESPLRIRGDADRHDLRAGNGDHSQAAALFRLFDAAQQQRLASHIAASMQGVRAFIVERQLAHFDRADVRYGAQVRAALAAAGSADGPA